MIELKGVVPPIVTPLTEQETLDGEGLKNMVRHLLEGGVHGIFVLGSTGEYPCLEDEVKWEAVKVVVEEVNGRVPVLAGVTGVGTKQTLTNLAKAQDQGVDAVVVSPGYYYPHTQGELLHHFERIHNQTQVPIMVYNIPSRVRSALELDTVAQLAQMDSVIGIKDTSGDFAFFQDLLTMAAEVDNFSVLQGDEAHMGASCLMGADGIVPGIGNLDPVRCVQLYEAGVRRDVDRVIRLQRELRSPVCYLPARLCLWWTEEGIEPAGSSSALSDGSRGFPYTGGSGNSKGSVDEGRAAL